MTDHTADAGKMVADPRVEQTARSLARSDGDESKWPDYRERARRFVADFDLAAAATDTARQPMVKPVAGKVV